MKKKDKYYLLFIIGGFPNKPALKFFQSDKNDEIKTKEMTIIINNFILFIILFFLIKRQL